MRILISNDDGVRAPGILALTRRMARLGDVFVVAPDRQRSASSHGITFHRPLYVERVELGAGETEAYAVSGTPVDCVKWAITVLGRDLPFDWMVSGINEGANLAVDVLYSGTVAAAGEAALQRVPAMALSLCGPPWPFDEAAEAALVLVEAFMQERDGWPADTFLNVNFPAHGLREAPWRATELGARGYRDAFRKEVDGEGKLCYRYAGEAVEERRGPSTDVIAVKTGAISVTPLRYRFTNQDWLATLETWMARSPRNRGG